jgi:hypothetical protein
MIVRVSLTGTIFHDSSISNNYYSVQNYGTSYPQRAEQVQRRGCEVAKGKKKYGFA